MLAAKAPSLPGPNIRTTFAVKARLWQHWNRSKASTKGVSLLFSSACGWTEAKKVNGSESYLKKRKKICAWNSTLTARYRRCNCFRCVTDPKMVMVNAVNASRHDKSTVRRLRKRLNGCFSTPSNKSSKPFTRRESMASSRSIMCSM